MLNFVNKYGSNIHSQNGEDGIVQECVRRLGLTSGHAVEVGGNDGQWMSNTRLLIDQGWSGKFIEADYNLYLKCKENWAHNPNVLCQCSVVDGKNVNAFVDDSCDVLSIDTDGADYEIFKGLKVKPKIVIVEIDSSIPPNVDGVNSDGGVSYKVMLMLGIAKKYFLVCHTGNMIFVGNNYRQRFPAIKGDGLANADLYFNRGWVKGAAA